MSNEMRSILQEVLKDVDFKVKAQASAALTECLVTQPRNGTGCFLSELDSGMRSNA